MLLDEYAIRVFSLMSHMVRIDAEKKLTLLTMSVMGNAKKSSYDDLFRVYNEARRDPVSQFLFDIDKASGDEGIDKLAKLLG